MLNTSWLIVRQGAFSHASWISSGSSWPHHDMMLLCCAWTKQTVWYHKCLAEQRDAHWPPTPSPTTHQCHNVTCRPCQMQTWLTTNQLTPPIPAGTSSTFGTSIFSLGSALLPVSLSSSPCDSSEIDIASPSSFSFSACCNKHSITPDTHVPVI